MILYIYIYMSVCVCVCVCVCVFVHLSIVFWLYKVLQYRSSMSSEFLDFHTAGGISSDQSCVLSFSKKGDLRIAKNYRDISLTSITAKIYNALLLNRIEPEIEKIHWKNQNDFRWNRSTTSQVLTIRAKNLQATLLFVDFSKAFDSIHRRMK